ncbi:MAG: glycosyltransferase [Opitutales bacterium]|nr:glycosyltransferase [Opitutales bacterium]
MKLIALIHSLDPRTGGTVRVVVDLQPHLAAEGLEVDLICADSEDAEWLPALRQLPGLRIHALGPLNNGYAYSRKWDRILKKLLPGADAVLMHGLWKYPLVAARRACKSMHKPLFVYPHGMLDPWFDREYPLKAFKKRLYWTLVERKNIHAAHKVLFTAPDEERLAREHWNLDPRRNCIAPIGIEPPLELAAVSEDSFSVSNSDERILLFLGRVVKKKGVDLLVQAFAQLPPLGGQSLRLIVAGPGMDSPYGNRVRELAAHSHYPIEFPGMIEGEAKWQQLRSCDALCLPSHQENFGLVIAEALAAGRPVLTTHSVNIADYITLDQSGWVEQDTLDGVRKLLQQWIHSTPVEREALRRNARRSFEQRFSAAAAAKLLVGVLQDTGAGERMSGGLVGL